MKSFEEFLTEKFELDHGVTVEKDKTHTGTFYHKAEQKKEVKHNVYLHGEHIGHTISHSHANHKKIPGTRRVKPATYSVQHKTHYTGGRGWMRTDYGADVHYLANMMARHHKNAKNES